MPTPECLCCGAPMKVTRTKSEKPYVRCDEGCAVQVFVKSPRGVRLFSERYGTAWLGGKPVAEPAAPAAAVKPAPAAKKEPTPKPAAEKKEPAAATTAEPEKKGGRLGFF